MPKRPNDSLSEHNRRAGYEASLEEEKRLYENCAYVHNLPDIFHYWSNRHVRPKLEQFGFGSPNEMFRKYLVEQCQTRRTATKRFVSIGSGNCDLEIDLGLHLRATGHTDFVIDCLDLNPAMLERGRVAAAQQGIANHLNFIEADFNAWNPKHEYDAVIANQSLHHVLKLEGLFAQIKNSLKPHGSFVVSDIIGRNGHQRWPEALEIVWQFWRQLPPSYRFNRLLRRYEELYENWDCSGEGFEGIRSQDILPLLLQCFHFQLFVGFANVIDPFVDRAFGHNFNPTEAWDRNFIDCVHRRDEDEIASGRIGPTHILAVMGKDPSVPITIHEPMTPEFCLRGAPLVAVVAQIPQEPYELHGWPHNTRRELELVCDRLKEAEVRSEKRTAWALQLRQELEERTAWALRLNAELEEKTAWALHLKQETEDLATRELQFSKELERLCWARAIDRRFHRPLTLGLWMVRWVRDRVKEVLSGKRREHSISHR
jgi:SAM-dependent methyltransferase